jgi:Uma2 family endonuclease
MMSIATTAREIEYPSSDGQPMAETPLHVETIILLHQALQDFFHDRPDVFIASDVFWYWEEGNRNARIAPDVMVVPEVEPKDLSERRSFLSWEEGGAIPSAVFEIASRGTWEEDLEDKYDTYERLGVREYFVFDPEGAYLVPVLQGWRLHGKTYRRIKTAAIESRLGFRLRPEGMMLRLIDCRTGMPIPSRAEGVAAAQGRADSEKQRADSEKQRADALATELELLKQQRSGSGS